MASGARDHAIEIDLTGLHLRGEVFHADDVRARGLRELDVLAGGEHRDAQRLARAMRHHGGTAHLLVGLGGVDAEVDGAIDGLVELRRGEFLDHLQRVVDRILLARLNLRSSRPFHVLRLPCAYSTTSTPIERASPRWCSLPRRDRRREIRRLLLRDLSSCLRVILPTLAVLGVPLPFSMPIALRSAPTPAASS
jgi:hypothetical protein